MNLYFIEIQCQNEGVALIQTCLKPRRCFLENKDRTNQSTTYSDQITPGAPWRSSSHCDQYPLSPKFPPLRITQDAIVPEGHSGQLRHYFPQEINAHAAVNSPTNAWHLPIRMCGLIKHTLTVSIAGHQMEWGVSVCVPHCESMIIDRFLGRWGQGQDVLLSFFAQCKLPLYFISDTLLSYD